MNDEQKRKLELLSRCTFIPGSFPKKFVRDMKSYEGDLSPKQAYWIDRLYYMYRVQIGLMQSERNKPAFIDPTMPFGGIADNDQNHKIYDEIKQLLPQCEPANEKQTQAMRKLEAWNRKAGKS